MGLKTMAVALVFTLAAGCAADTAEELGDGDAEVTPTLLAEIMTKTVTRTITAKDGERIAPEYFGFGRIKVTFFTTGTPTTGFPMRGGMTQVYNDSGTPVTLRSPEITLDCDQSPKFYRTVHKDKVLQGKELWNFQAECPNGTLVSATLKLPMEREK